MVQLPEVSSERFPLASTVHTEAVEEVAVIVSPTLDAALSCVV
jgi:hypothetical protein